MTTEKLASELADEVLKLRAENAKLKAKAEEWKHEAKSHHEIACGFMDEVKRLRAEVEKAWRIADGLYYSSLYCEVDERIKALQVYEQAKEADK